MTKLREDRYHCLACCDEGSITVWRSSTLEQLRDGGQPKSWDKAFARCKCWKGQKYPTKHPSAVQFDPSVHCQVGVWIWNGTEYIFPTQDQERATAREFANRPPVAVEFNPDHWNNR